MNAAAPAKRAATSRGDRRVASARRVNRALARGHGTSGAGWLRDLGAAADLLGQEAQAVLDEMGGRRGDFAGEVIDWDNAWVSEAAFHVDDDGNAGWGVLVEEASPRAETFVEVMRASLEAMGWERVSVRTTW